MTSGDTNEKVPTAANRLIVVSGMSGSGKTIALRTLEDLDFYCVDNMPSALLPAFVAEVTRSGLHQRLAVGIDVRNRPRWRNSRPSTPHPILTRPRRPRLMSRDFHAFRRERSGPIGIRPAVPPGFQGV